MPKYCVLLCLVALFVGAMVFANCPLVAGESKLKCGTLDGKVVCADKGSDTAKKIHGDLAKKLGGKKKDCVVFALGADLTKFCPTGIKNCKTDSTGGGICCCNKD